VVASAVEALPLAPKPPNQLLGTPSIGLPAMPHRMPLNRISGRERRQQLRPRDIGLAMICRSATGHCGEENGNEDEKQSGSLPDGTTHGAQYPVRRP
jgi:hypothetical protein